VNQVSYDITPTKRWFRIENTRLDALEADLKAAIPGWRGYGGAGPTGSSWDGLTISWSGWAVDPDGARAWMFGGGHNNSSNNGIYRFDFFKMKWSIDSLPTDPSTLPSNYNNSSSYSTYYPALDATVQKRDQGTLGTINDIWHDELPDGKPTSRHTYRGFTYAKSLNKLILMCRRLWTYNLATKRWDFKRLVNDYISPQGSPSNTGAFANDQVISLEGGVTTWDDAARRVVHSAHGSSGNSRQALYDFSQGAQGAWLHEPYVPFYGVGHANAFMGPRKVLYFRIPQDVTRGGYGSPGEYEVRDLDQPVVSASDGKPSYKRTAGGTAVWSDGTDPTTLLNPSSGEDDNPALVYIPSINRFWFFAQLQAGGYQLSELDPTTSPAWSMKKLYLTGDKPTFSGGAGLVGTKMTYIPAFNAVFLQDAASRNLYIYRF
jgi:hypothetical protein